MRSLFFLVALHSSTGLCATLDLESFDYKQCIHWHMTSDTGGAESASYKAALRAAKSRLGFSVFSAGGTGSDGKYIEQFGICSYTNPVGKARFYCPPNQDYPFAGATYESSKAQEIPGVIVLSCLSGCGAKLPESVHEVSQDIVEPNAFAAREKARRAQFEQTCHSKERNRAPP